jgi:hypothetical protein
MRIMGLVFTGMLAVCAADSAFAAAYTKDCKGTHQSLEAGVCHNLKYANPNRVVQERSSDFYRSSSQKRHKNKTPSEDKKPSGDKQPSEAK